MLAASVLPVTADLSAEREFLWDEANSRMVSAQTRDDFLAASLIYRELADKGVKNGALFYNLGVALMQAGEHGQALEAFHRAERYTGSSEDIRRNLLICLAGEKQDEDVSLPWHRFLLFWHYGFSGSVRVAVAAGAFSMCWLALVAGSIGYRRFARPMLVLAFLVLVLFGSSAATTLHLERKARGAIRETGVIPEDRSPPA
jgi:hypothetical protein